MLAADVKTRMRLAGWMSGTDVKTHSHDGRSFLDSTVLELLNEIDALRAQVAELRARLVADIIVADIIASGFPQA